MAFPSGTQDHGGEGAGWGLPDAVDLGTPQDQVGWRNVEKLAGVVCLPAVQVATGGFLQGVERVQRVGVLRGVEIEPDVIWVVPPRIHHYWYKGGHQGLLSVSSPCL